MKKTLLLLALALPGVPLVGCAPPPGGSGWGSPTGGSLPVPEPINLQLPKQVRIFPLTGTRTFSEEGGISGIEVRIECLDDWGDNTKAFGHFRFELYRYVMNVRDPRGTRIAVWNVDLNDPQDNRRHWDHIMRNYSFKLGWNDPLSLGRRFVLDAYFDSPFGPRLYDEHVFIAGE